MNKQEMVAAAEVAEIKMNWAEQDAAAAVAEHIDMDKMMAEMANGGAPGPVHPEVIAANQKFFKAQEVYFAAKAAADGYGNEAVIGGAPWDAFKHHA